MKSTSVSPYFTQSPLSALPSTLLPKVNTVNGFLCLFPEIFHKYTNVYKYIKSTYVYVLMCVSILCVYIFTYLYIVHISFCIYIHFPSTDILFFHSIIWLFHSLFFQSLINDMLVISSYFCYYKQCCLEHPCILNIYLLMEYSQNKFLEFMSLLLTFT